MKPVEPYWYVLTKEYALLVSGQFQLELNGPLLFFFLTLTILNLLYFVYTCVDFMERFLQPTLSSNL